MFAGIPVFDIGIDGRRRLHLKHMRKPQILQRRINARHADIVGELSQKHCREQRHRVGELMHHLEIVLLDVDSVNRASRMALATVDAAVFHNESLAIVDTDGLGRANLHAPRTTDAVAFVNLKGMVKHVY